MPGPQFVLDSPTWTTSIRAVTWTPSLTVSLEGKPAARFDIHSPGDLGRGMVVLRAYTHAEMRLTLRDGRRLTALAHGDHAWLEWSPGDDGRTPTLRTENPDFDGDKAEAWSFQGADGATAQSPAGWTYPLGRVFDAFRHTLKHDAPDPGLKWVEST